MLATRDFLVPHLAGMPYLDKPPALFWAEAASIAVLGRTPLAVRLPAALAAAAILLLIGLAAERRAGGAFALRAVALLAAAPLFAVLSAYVIFDMPLALCVTIVWLGVAGEMESGAAPRRRAAMFAAVALGLLLKGPVMLAWVVGGSLATALLARDRAPLRWLGWLPGWGIVLGTAGLWFGLATLRHPEYPRYAFLEESFQRVATGAFHREQPWWFVFAVLAGGALAWSLVTPWSERRLRRCDSPSNRATRAALGFLLFATVFFTLSRSKLVTYLLPAFPALAWLAAAAWSDAAPQRRAGILTGALYLAVALAAAAGALVSPLIDFVPPGPPPFEREAARALAMAVALVSAVLAALAFTGVIRHRPTWVFVSGLAFTPTLLILGGPRLREEAALRSGEPLARAIAARPAATVRYEGCYSPGTDYLLGRRSEWVSDLGHETASNYHVRYRDVLKARGQWTALAAAPVGARPRIIVRPARTRSEPLAAPGTVFFRDDRFVASWADRAGP